MNGFDNISTVREATCEGSIPALAVQHGHELAVYGSQYSRQTQDMDGTLKNDHEPPVQLIAMTGLQ